MFATMKRSLWAGMTAALFMVAAVAAVVVTPAQTTQADGFDQPVWCHLTGNTWKAQLGAPQSGDRHVAFALLMTQQLKDATKGYGNVNPSTPIGSQVYMSNDKNKIDASFCEAQAVIPVNEVSYSVWTDGDAVCATETVTQTRVKTTVSHFYVKVGKNWTYKEETSAVVETQSRAMTSTEILHCNPPQKEDKVKYGRWEDEHSSCHTGTVEQKRKVTTTKYTYSWDAEHGKWVEHESKPMVSYEHQSRAMTSDELRDCTRKPHKQDLVVVDPVVSDQDCEAKTVTITTTTTTTKYTYTWDDTKWVEHENVSSTVQTTYNVAMTEDQIAACPTEQDPQYASLTFKIYEPTCAHGGVVEYGNLDHATVVEGSTVSGFEGPGSYEVIFKADEGYVFSPELIGESDDPTTFTLRGDLFAVETSDDCGEVLGEGDTTDTTPPATLPETSGEMGGLVIAGAAFVALLAGGIAARRVLSRSL